MNRIQTFSIERTYLDIVFRQKGKSDYELMAIPETPDV